MNNKWKKSWNLVQFKDVCNQDRIPCPYCEKDFPSNLSLVRHALKDHNWNRGYRDPLEGYEVVEVLDGGALKVIKVEEETTPKANRDNRRDT